MKPRIAVFSGPTATVINNPPLVSSRRVAGEPAHGEVLRAQRLAAPASVLIEAFTAHPLERDAADLYAPPDGWLDAGGCFREQQVDSTDTPVYQVELSPDDGLYMLPYVARRREGMPWAGDGLAPDSDETESRQPFFPDAARLFEEIDRFGIESDGRNQQLSNAADYDFFRVAPPAGYRRGLTAEQRTDFGEGDIRPEVPGVDYFPYRPRHLRKEPSRETLATITNVVSATLRDGDYAGALWLEGSPFVEETLYWLHLVVDTSVPIVGVASPDWAHGVIGNVGDRNVLDAVRYVVSGAWRDTSGVNQIGGVLINGGRVIAAREVQKLDARGIGYGVTGGIGGVVGAIAQGGHVSISFLPTRAHTVRSHVSLSQLPTEVQGVRADDRGVAVPVPVSIRSDRGLRPSSLPRVRMVKYGRYSSETSALDPHSEVDVLERVSWNLREAPLAGFVAEGGAPHGHLSGPLEAALERAALSGMPVVKVGRGNADGFVPGERTRLPRGRLAIAGSNLSATKARLLLMACLLRFGSLPPATDPDRPTAVELQTVVARLADYQRVFDSH